jgi:hypothetical protein
MRIRYFLIYRSKSGCGSILFIEDSKKFLKKFIILLFFMIYYLFGNIFFKLAKKMSWWVAYLIGLLDPDLDL